MLPDMFMMAKPSAVCRPQISMVAAQVVGAARPERKAPSESMATAASGPSTNVAPRVASEQKPSEKAATPLRLSQRLPVRARMRSTSGPPRKTADHHSGEREHAQVAGSRRGDLESLFEVGREPGNEQGVSERPEE